MHRVLGSVRSLAETCVKVSAESGLPPTSAVSIDSFAGGPSAQDKARCEASLAHAKRLGSRVAKVHATGSGKTRTVLAAADSPRAQSTKERKGELFRSLCRTASLARPLKVLPVWQSHLFVLSRRGRLEILTCPMMPLPHVISCHCPDTPHNLNSYSSSSR